MAAVKSLYRTGISLRWALCWIAAGLTAVTAPAYSSGPGAESEAQEVVASVAATDMEQDLEQRLLQLDGIVADFTQQITNARGHLVEQASGRLHLAKPRFRWEVSEPYPQIILADGNDLQIYDPDLEQVTQRTIDGALDQAPLALLTSAELDLHLQFAVTQAFAGNQSTRYTLRPRSIDALFERMELVFVGEALDALLIYDHAGQQTLIRFHDYRADQVIQSAIFELEYPPGTDFVK